MKSGSLKKGVFGEIPNKLSLLSRINIIFVHNKPPKSAGDKVHLSSKAEDFGEDESREMGGTSRLAPGTGLEL